MFNQSGKLAKSVAKQSNEIMVPYELCTRRLAILGGLIGQRLYLIMILKSLQQDFCDRTEHSTRRVALECAEIGQLYKIQKNHLKILSS